MTQPSPSIRVLALTPTGVISGAERVLIRHALKGSAVGDHWTVAAPDGPTARRLEDEGLERLPIPELKLGSGPRLLAAMLLLVRNFRALVALAPSVRRADVIVANSVLCLPLLRVLRPSAPVLWLVHDVITRGDLAKMARWSAPCITRSAPVSNAAAALSLRLGIPTTVVPNGVDVVDDGALTDDDRHPGLLRRPSGPAIIGLNAVLTAWKGQQVLLEAAARIRQPVLIELLGGTLPKDHAYELQLRERAGRPDLEGKVRFLGHSERPLDAMRRWTIAVSASIEPEAGPLSVLEAMAIGLPVVVSDHGGATEVVGQAGVRVPVGDHDALAQAISDLLEDPERCRALGDAGRRRAVEVFDRSRLEGDFRGLLADLVVGAESRAGT